MAARDRFGALGAPVQSTLQRYIQSACDPANYEPNLALDLEIADLINSKKGNAPREAAVAIVNYINHRNQNVSLLALTLLDICVKNCGYPFHLQISTKEFLNELVRRFPERPPMRPSRVQLRVLEAIEEWRQTICQNSKYKKDLGYIRDMHRLLSFKGYMFPEVKKEDAAVLNPSDNLKSAEELEEEERAAQSAKLQELIRRGAPEDLQEANKLMKVMAGYDTRHRTDYRAKAAEEVSKIQQKAKILEEMLQGYTKEDKIAEGDLPEELANALRSAQPKIQKMCEEESDDTEAVAKLFEINDSIHRTLERYKLIKKGDFEAASKIPKGTLGSTTGVNKTADNELALIDLGGEPLQPSTNGFDKSAAKSDQKVESLEDDLLGLSFQDSTYGQGGGIALGLGPGPAPSLFSSSPQAAPAGMASFQGTSMPLSTSSGATSSSHLQPQQQVQPQASTDPFSSITKLPSRQSSPFDYQQGAFPTPTSTPSKLPSQQSTTCAPTANVAATAAKEEEEEWTFASALPEGSELPASNDITVTNSAVNVVFAVSRPASGEHSLRIITQFTNNTAHMISDVTFQVAVTKGINLRLNHQSGRTLVPHQRSGITQLMHLSPVAPGSGNQVKVRWKLSYRIGGSGGASASASGGLGSGLGQGQGPQGPGEVRMEEGEVPSLGVA